MKKSETSSTQQPTPHPHDERESNRFAIRLPRLRSRGIHPNKMPRLRHRLPTKITIEDVRLNLGTQVQDQSMTNVVRNRLVISRDFMKRIESELVMLIPRFEEEKSDSQNEKGEKLDLVFELIAILVGVVETASCITRKRNKNLTRYEILSRNGRSGIMHAISLRCVRGILFRGDSVGYSHLFIHFLPKLRHIISRLPPKPPIHDPKQRLVSSRYYVREELLEFVSEIERIQSERNVCCESSNDQTNSKSCSKKWETISADVLFFNVFRFFTIFDCCRSFARVSRGFYENLWGMTLKNVRVKDHLDMYYLFRSVRMVGDSVLSKLLEFDALDHTVVLNNYLFPVVFYGGQFPRTLEFLAEQESSYLNEGKDFKSLCEQSSKFTDLLSSWSGGGYANFLQSLEATVLFVKRRNPNFMISDPRKCILITRFVLTPGNLLYYTRYDKERKSVEQEEEEDIISSIEYTKYFEIIFRLYDGSIENYILDVICKVGLSDFQSLFVVEDVLPRRLYETLSWFLRERKELASNQAFLRKLCLETVIKCPKIIGLISEKYILDPSYDDHFLLRHCCESGHVGAVRTLLKEERIDPTYNSNQPLLLALKSLAESTEKLKNLTPPLSSDGFTPKISSTNHFLDIVHLLFSKNDSVFLCTSQHWDVFLGICGKYELWKLCGSEKYVEFLKLLIDRTHPKSLIQNNCLLTLLDTEAPVHTIQTLLSSYFDPSFDDNILLIRSCEKGDKEMVKMLLKFESVDPAARNNEPIKATCRCTKDSTREHFGSEMDGPAGIIEILLETGKVDPRVDENYCLKTSTDIEIVKILLELPQIDVSENDYEFVLSSINNQPLFEYLLNRDDVPLSTNSDFLKEICEQFKKEQSSFNFMILVKHPRVGTIPIEYQNFFVLRCIRWRRSSAFLALLKLFRNQSEETVRDFRRECEGWHTGIRILEKQRGKQSVL